MNPSIVYLVFLVAWFVVNFLFCSLARHRVGKLRDSNKEER